MDKLNRYIQMENRFVEYFKEVSYVLLVLVLCYRIVFQLPDSVEFEHWVRVVLIAVGTLMIPGLVVKLILLFRKNEE